jgi:hypothetical protein
VLLLLLLVVDSEADAGLPGDKLLYILLERRRLLVGGLLEWYS